MKNMLAKLPQVRISEAVQLVGGIGAGAGLYLLAGLAWSLLAGGVALVAVGTLSERRSG